MSFISPRIHDTGQVRYMIQARRKSVPIWRNETNMNRSISVLVQLLCIMMFFWVHNMIFDSLKETQKAETWSCNCILLFRLIVWCVMYRIMLMFYLRRNKVEYCWCCDLTWSQTYKSIMTALFSHTNLFMEGVGGWRTHQFDCDIWFKSLEKCSKLMLII